jgi:sugar porter (SP) family MFS transporter
MATAESSSVHPAYNMPFIWAAALAAAMGGLMFGYDWIVISGTAPFYESFFQLQTSWEKGWAMGSALVGCLAGAIVSGSLSDTFGRKRLLILAAAVFVVSSVATGLAGSFFTFNLWRIAGGLAIGLASNLSPMYIAEIAPANVRGRLVSMNQFAIVIGILLAQAANYLISEYGPGPRPDLWNYSLDPAKANVLAVWNVASGWRWMFGVTAIPATLFFALMFLVPESPRWLVRSGQSAAAWSILARIGGNAHADREVADIQATVSGEARRVDFRELFEGRMPKIVSLGVALAVLQQWCGVNVLFYYAPKLFKGAGYATSEALFNLVVVGAVNLVFTILAVAAVDRFGRRKLMLLGFAGLTVAELLLAGCFYTGQGGMLVLVLILAAIGCYAVSLAPVTWVVLSEIYPNRIRGAAMSVSVFALWTACFLLTFTFPILEERLGTWAAFSIYSAICMIGFFVVLAALPETKAKSLEEIERQLTC